MNSENRCKVVAIANGSAHSVALLENGMVLSWGRGEDGQLGCGVTQNLKYPCVVTNLLGAQISFIQCGAEFTLAGSPQNRQLYGWGWCDSGNLDNEMTDGIQAEPATLQFFEGQQIISVGCGDGHTAVVTAQGDLYTLGNNQNGQLGVGHNRLCYQPQLVSYFRGVSICQVACGAEHCAAVTENGLVYSWGCGVSCGIDFRKSDYDGRSQLIKGPQTRWTPTWVESLEGVFIVEVVCGWRHNMALSQTGDLFVWGWNAYGQLGTGDTVDRKDAAKIWHPEGLQWVLTAAGWRNSSAVDTTGQLFVWGWNKFGQLGLGNYTDYHYPQKVQTLCGKEVRLLSCGWRHTMVVTRDDEFYVWGRGSYGRLGLEEDTDKLWPSKLCQLSGDNLCPSKLLTLPTADCRLDQDVDLDMFVVPDAQTGVQGNANDFAVPM